MKEKEAVEILIKQIRDYDCWSAVVFNSLMRKKNLCTHPYPSWMRKKDGSKKCFCMVCGKVINYNKEVNITWKSFDTYEKVESAIKYFEEKMKENAK